MLVHVHAHGQVGAEIHFIVKTIIHERYTIDALFPPCIIGLQRSHLLDSSEDAGLPNAFRRAEPRRSFPWTSPVTGGLDRTVGWCVPTVLLCAAEHECFAMARPHPSGSDRAHPGGHPAADVQSVPTTAPVRGDDGRGRPGDINPSGGRQWRSAWRREGRRPDGHGDQRSAWKTWQALWSIRRTWWSRSVSFRRLSLHLAW